MEGLDNKPSVIKTESDEDLRLGLKKARQVLLSRGLVAFPTESFYGLGVNALDEEAIGRLFEIKERESSHPVLILIPSQDSLHSYVKEVPKVALELIKRFWPGGLKLLFEAGPGISRLLTADTGKIGIRLSSHPVASALVKAMGSPITGTSANISGDPGCCRIDDLKPQLARQLDAVLDAGPLKGGTGSTVVDVTDNMPRILRQGEISEKEILNLIER